MFELRGASKRFGELTALQPTDLLIPRSRTTVLIGPSGSGKSTLLRLLIGLLLPDAGEIRFDGAVVEPGDLLALRQRVGFVVQEGGLFPHLTAERNITLMARHMGRDEGFIRARILELTALSRLPEDSLMRYPAQLSGGQRQRVSLMRALMMDPDVLLLDEPLGALDPVTRFDLQNDLHRMFTGLEKTVVLVTHDLAEAGFFGHHLVMMHDGRIAQQGTVSDFIETPADPLVARFIAAQRAPLETLGGGSA